MKHKRLAAALLAGCGARAAASAHPAGSRELKSTPPDSMHATAAITEQYTLEKVVQAENGGTVRLNIHLPRLESDSADAARINAEIARYYEYDVQEYADCPEAADPDSWDIPCKGFLRKSRPCIDRASPEFSGLHNKKERQIL